MLQVVVAVNVALYVSFAVLVILYFLLPAKHSVTCASPPSAVSALSAAAVVAYVYKALLALISLATAGGVLYYGIGISKRLSNTGALDRGQSRARIRKVNPFLVKYVR